MIYADYNGSAPLKNQVKEFLIERLQKGIFANPNAIHPLGMKIMSDMEKCRANCAKLLGANPNQLIFNSGSTEGTATIFHSLLSTNDIKKKNVIIVSGIEHSAIINTAKYYESLGYCIKTIPVGDNGLVDLDVLKLWLEEFIDRIVFVSIMAANNETGVIQDFKCACQLCHKVNVPFFSDTTQYIGKRPFNFEESDLDYAVLSGHKIGALIGSGILLVKNPHLLKPLLTGGGQEKGLRGGTQNYIAYETLPIALQSCLDNFEKLTLLKMKKEEFEKKLKNDFPELIIFGENAERLDSTSFIAYPGIHGQAVQIELEAQDIFVTTSSACADNQPRVSRVLRAMNIDEKVGRGAVRISLGPNSPLEHYDKIYNALRIAYINLSRLKNF